MNFLQCVGGFALLALLAACAANPATAPAEQSGQPEEPLATAASSEAKQRVLPKADFSMSEPIRLVVHRPGPGDIDDESFRRTQKTFGAMEGVMGGAMAIDLVAPTVYSAANVALGLPIVVGLMAIDAYGRGMQDRLVKAVGQTDFASLLQKELARDLQTSDAEEGKAPRPRLEVVPLAYGVVEDKSRPGIYCAVASVLVTLHDGGKELFRDQFIIHPNGRSIGAPIPVCRFKEMLADENSGAVPGAFADYARALPGFLEARMPGLPWKP